MKLPQIDPARLEEEWRADEEVLQSLSANGDRPWITRAVDVSFRGSEEGLAKLSDASKSFGLIIIDKEIDAQGNVSLFLEREMKADASSIKALTKKCLQIAALFDLEYEGWGCEAKPGSMT